MDTDTSALAPAQPLQLPRLTRTEAQARSAVAQRVRDVPFAWGSESWTLTLEPLAAPGALVAGTGENLLRTQWGGAGFEVVLGQEAVQGWIAGRFADVDAPMLPPEFAAAALEAACDSLLEALAGLRRGPARLDRLWPGPAQGQEQAHVFDVTLRHGQAVVRARLATNSLGLMLMAGVVARMSPAANDLPAGALPLVLRAEVGFTWLAASELASLAPGDTVLMEHVFLNGADELWWGAQDWGLRVRWDGAALTAVTGFTRGGWNMPYNEDEVDSQDRIDAMAALPLRVAFDLGERTMTLGELQGLQAGQVIELGRPLSGAVSLRVNGALVGVGELVEIDGRIGVTVASLLRPSDLEERRGGGEFPQVTPHDDLDIDDYDDLDAQAQPS